MIYGCQKKEELYIKLHELTQVYFDFLSGTL
jgi:hypothetical protein